MSQANTSINHHVEDYLNYYCELPHSPKFAILLKGKWGSGKTWFINQYRGKLEAEGKKSLYVSLYGVSKYSEIEESLFEQLDPIFSYKGRVLVGKILKGALKATFKIDFNHDGKDDGTPHENKFIVFSSLQKRYEYKNIGFYRSLYGEIGLKYQGSKARTRKFSKFRNP